MKLIMTDSAGKKARFINFVEKELNKMEFGDKITLSIEKIEDEE